MPKRLLSYGLKSVLLALRQAARLSQSLGVPLLQGIMNRCCMSFAQKVDVSVWCSDPSPAIVNKTDYIRGGFANIYHAEYTGKRVALKTPRWYEDNDSRHRNHDTIKHFIREFVIMVLLGYHPNVIQINGLSTYRGIPCLILPWMVNETLPQYLRSRGHETRLHWQCCRIKLVLNIIKGMIHLKRSGIIHGDLKGRNILIDDSGNAVIADFGLSCFVEYHSDWISHLAMADSQDTDGSRAGTLRWMAPELIFPENFGRLYARPTFESDIFALGMVIYEVYSGILPYHEDNNWMALSHIIRGKRPQRPTGIPDRVWGIVQQCWGQDPSLRPSIEAVYTQLTGE